MDGWSHEYKMNQLEKEKNTLKLQFEKSTDKFFKLLSDIREVCDKIEAKEGKSEIWQMLFNAHNTAFLNPRPLTEKEIEYGKQLTEKYKKEV